MTFDEYQRRTAGNRRTYRIEDLPDDMAAELEAGLDALWNPDTAVEEGDTVIR